jgi:hypothetical protein
VLALQRTRQVGNYSGHEVRAGAAVLCSVSGSCVVCQGPVFWVGVLRRVSGSFVVCQGPVSCVVVLCCVSGSIVVC